MMPSVAIPIGIASRCEIGQRDRNEDQVRCGRHGTTHHAVLCDGAGGHRDGQEASRRAADGVAAALAACRTDARAGSGDGAFSNAADRADAILRLGHPAFTPCILTQAVRRAHEAVQAAHPADNDTDRMHSTVVVLWIDTLQQAALWSHVGDSRLYLVRGGVLRLLTADDSVVQRLLDAGLLSAPQAAVHPHRHQLIAALGMAGAVEPHTSPEAIALHEGDAFLLCSDGWWEALPEHTIPATLAAATSPDDWLAGMQRHIEAVPRPRQDNFSAIAVWIGRA